VPRSHTAARVPGAFTAARRDCAAWRVSSLAASRRFAAPAARGFGLAPNSPTRLYGRTLLAVNAPPSGRPALRSRNGAPEARFCLKQGLRPRTPDPT
jgi:hypothetical protein